MTGNTMVPALKDNAAAHPVATTWRTPLRDIVRAFAAEDYSLQRRPTSVAPLRPAVADQIREYIEDYGETIIDAPDDTWDSSVSQWMEDHWHVLIDLWTEESGESDMVLSVRIFEVDNGFQIEVESVYVP